VSVRAPSDKCALCGAPYLPDELDDAYGRRIAEARGNTVPTAEESCILCPSCVGGSILLGAHIQYSLSHGNKVLRIMREWIVTAVFYKGFMFLLKRPIFWIWATWHCVPLAYKLASIWHEEFTMGALAAHYPRECAELQRRAQLVGLSHVFGLPPVSANAQQLAGSSPAERSGNA